MKADGERDIVEVYIHTRAQISTHRQTYRQWKKDRLTMVRGKQIKSHE